MAKLPKYIKIELSNESNKLAYKISIKKWGLPIMIFKSLKENYNFKWYQYWIYPYLCLKLMFRGDEE